MEERVTIHKAGALDVSALCPLFSFFHLTLKFQIGYNFFLHQQEAGEILNRQPKFQVNSCIYVDALRDVKPCYSSTGRFVTLGRDSRIINLSTSPKFIAQLTFRYGSKLQI